MEKSVIERFGRYYREGPPDACWLWLGGVTGRGYGAFWLDGRTVTATRVMWRVTHGADVPDDMVVRHRCDNRPCVNPAHLELGTAQQNVDDKVERGRQYQGARHHFARLTPDGVRALLAAYEGGAAVKDLAARYGVTDVAVWHILSGRNWKSVTGGVDVRRGRRDTQAYVARRLAEGARNTEIAAELGVTPEAVSYHKARLNND